MRSTDQDTTDLRRSNRQHLVRRLRIRLVLVPTPLVLPTTPPPSSSQISLVKTLDSAVDATSGRMHFNYESRCLDLMNAMLNMKKVSQRRKRRRESKKCKDVKQMKIKLKRNPIEKNNSAKPEQTLFLFPSLSRSALHSTSKQ